MLTSDAGQSVPEDIVFSNSKTYRPSVGLQPKRFRKKATVARAARRCRCCRGGKTVNEIASEGSDLSGI